MRWSLSGAPLTGYTRKGVRDNFRNLFGIVPDTFNVPVTGQAGTRRGRGLGMATGLFMSTKVCVEAGAREVRAARSWLSIGATRWRILRAADAEVGRDGDWVVAACDQPGISGRNEQVAMREVAAGDLRKSDLSSIPTETERLSADRYRLGQKRTLTLSGALLFLVGLMSLCLVGCGNDDRSAPKPTINPDAHVYTTIRILVSDPRIDDVRVESDWVVGNLGCAPIIQPEGYARVQQVTTLEQVTKIDGGYKARLLEDRFQRDKCNWMNGGMSVSFMQRGRGFALLGMGPKELNAGAHIPLICIPPFNIENNTYAGACYPAERLTPKLKKTIGKFTVTLEVES